MLTGVASETRHNDHVQMIRERLDTTRRLARCPAVRFFVVGLLVIALPAAAFAAAGWPAVATLAVLAAVLAAGAYALRPELHERFVDRR